MSLRQNDAQHILPADALNTERNATVALSVTTAAFNLQSPGDHVYRI
jgi:hypothetical protein